jgi:hypothetical protein
MGRRRKWKKEERKKGRKEERKVSYRFLGESREGERGVASEKSGMRRERYFWQCDELIRWMKIGRRPRGCQQGQNKSAHRAYSTRVGMGQVPMGRPVRDSIFKITSV